MNPINTNEILHKQEEDMVTISEKLRKAKLDERIFSPLYCKVCNFYGESSEDSTAHLKSRDHAERVSILASRKTFVLWGIENCPVPDDLDAGLVVPSIKLLLEKSGFSGGPLTITAIGDLEPILKQTPDVLPAISSSGVRLKHGREAITSLLSWTRDNPPPATIMLICGGDRVNSYSFLTGILRNKGYTIFLYPSLEYVLREPCSEMYTQPPAAWCCETGESAWCCIRCRQIHEAFGDKSLLGESFHGESIEDFTKHLESRRHKRIMLDVEDLLVWWDIDSCQVPNCYDARLVVPSIKRHLEESEYSARPLTITAIGDLKHTLKQTPHVLPAISSTGVLLKHVPGGFKSIWKELVRWTRHNPPPAKIILISGRVGDCTLEERGYGIVETLGVPLWESLLKDGDADAMASGSEEDKQETRRDDLWDKYSEWVESALFYCKPCSFDGKSVEDFTTHLNSSDHELRELDRHDMLVWWDINSCPVPDGCDARLVVPSIKWNLEKSGYSARPLTITAIGDLKHTLKQTPDVLPAISSTGVLLKHVPGGLGIWGELVNWTSDNPPPADIVLISSRVNTDLGCTRFLQNMRYTISLYPAWIEQCSEMNWQPSTAWCSETGESAWCCILCHHHTRGFDNGDESFHGKSVEDFTKHLESRAHLLSELDMVNTPHRFNMQSSCLHLNDATTMPEFQNQHKTLVLWDINSCPVPDGYDARVIVWSIKRDLEKSGLSGGPLTITAIGDLEASLEQTPSVLLAISSTGVLLKHVPRGLNFIWGELVRWTLHNGPPANIMLISGGVEHLFRDLVTRSYLFSLKIHGYHIVASGVPLWENLRKGSADNKQETRRHVLQDTCSETVKSALFYCCYGKSFDDFTMHLRSRDRALSKRSIEDEDEEDEDAEDENVRYRSLSPRPLNSLRSNPRRRALKMKMKMKSKKRSIEDEDNEDDRMTI